MVLGFSRHLKYGKIAIVVFLTVLIWVWADLALDETPPDRVALIEVDDSSSESLWVSFRQKSSVDIKVTLTGPHSAFATLDRRLRSEGKRLTFSFDAAQERMSDEGGHSLDVLAFIRKDKGLRSLGIKVEACVPESIDVNVVALSQKTLPIECFDDSGASVEALSEPTKVTIYAPENVRSARVELSNSEISQGRLKAIQKRPYIVLAEGIMRPAPTPVRITIPPAADPLGEETITSPKLGIALSGNLQGKYSVEVTNLNEVMGPIQIRATSTAKQAYEGMRYQIILEIDDEDIKQGEARREVQYNFPDGFVRSNEIRINQAPVQARFRLRALSSEGAIP